jgi:hypothetical protein
MVQRHSIILWKKAEHKDKKYEEISKEAYNILSLFQDYPQELKPNYLSVKSKKDAKEFAWNYENFNSVLKKGINREGENIFEDLGYSISFFSSMEEKKSCAFQMNVGNKNNKFYNTFIIDLPLSLNLYDKKIADTIRSLFEKLVQFYIPYWGCISNKVLSRKYGNFLDGNLPTTVHWMNYWSEDIIEMIGMRKIQKIVDQNSIISFQKGVLSIKDTAFDVDKEEDLKYHDELQNYLFIQ